MNVSCHDDTPLNEFRRFRIQDGCVVSILLAEISCGRSTVISFVRFDIHVWYGEDMIYYSFTLMVQNTNSKYI